MKDFMVPETHAFYACAALYISSSGFHAITLLFNICCFYIIGRIQCINSILNQLIVDKSINDNFLHLNSNHKFLMQDFPLHNDQKNGNSLKTIQNDDIFHHNNKLRIFNIHSDDISMKNALTKPWTNKTEFNNINKHNDIHHLDHLVNTFNIYDIKILLSKM